MIKVVIFFNFKWKQSFYVNINPTCRQFLMETRFYVNINPTCRQYTLQILCGHSSGTHFFILSLKVLRISDCFISLDTKSRASRPT